MPRKSVMLTVDEEYDEPVAPLVTKIVMYFLNEKRSKVLDILESLKKISPTPNYSDGCAEISFKPPDEWVGEEHGFDLHFWLEFDDKLAFCVKYEYDDGVTPIMTIPIKLLEEKDRKLTVEELVAFEV